MQGMMGGLLIPRKATPRTMQDERIVLRKISTPFYWIPKALLQNTKPIWQGILAYNALMYYAVDGRTVNIGIRQMAKLVGCSRQTLMRGMEDLIAKKALRVRERKNTKGGKRNQLPNEYTLVELGSKESI